MLPTDPKALLTKYQPKQLKILSVNQQLCMIRLTPDGKQLVGGTFEGTIRRWDASTDAYAELSVVPGHQGWVQSLAFDPKGERLFSADSWGHVACWNALEKEPKAIWSVKDAHDGWIHGLTVSPDGKRIATVGRDQQIRIASAEDGKGIHRIKHTEDVLAIAWHPDGKSIVTGDFKGLITIWDTATGKASRTLDAKTMYLKDRIQDVGGVRCFAFDPKGETLFAGGSIPKTGGFVQGMYQIISYEWASGKAKQTFNGSADTEGYIYDMVLHPDGFFMAVSSGQPGNGQLMFFHPSDPKPFMVQKLPNCHSLALYPGKPRLLVSATNANSAGNGRPTGKSKEEYPGNFSPIHVFDLPK